MSQRYPGGVITKSPTAPTQTAATGVWTLEQVAENVKNSTWPPNGPYFVEDVFSTYLYTGTGSQQTINNGIDLSGKGGLVWYKSRSSGAWNHYLIDSARGQTKFLVTNSTAAQDDFGDGSFNSTGFVTPSSTAVTQSTTTYATWTFRKQPKFFDVVKYTGNGTAGRAISHNLGSTPGCIIVKRLASAENWAVWHRGLTAGYWMELNNTNPATNAASGDVFGNGTTYVAPTSTQFTVGSENRVNDVGSDYIAYVFAHDAGGFGNSGNDSIISCGSYTGNGSGNGPTIDLGWEPQWVLIKRSGSVSTGNWFIFDNMRGLTVDQEPYLYANASSAEFSPSNFINPTSTGFNLETSAASVNANGDTYIYIAVRRGPMKTPTDATKVFSAITTSSSSTGTQRTTGFPVDLQILGQKNKANFVDNWVVDRLRGVSTTTSESGRYVITNGSQAESTAETITRNFGSTGFQDSSYYSTLPMVWWSFRRSPGFLDIVCYTGTGVARTIDHKLGVTPELMFVRRRNTTGNWSVYVASVGATAALSLNSTAIPNTNSVFWDNTAPTSTVFTVGTNVSVNASGGTYVAYLFSSVPGVSKIGSYTGNDTSVTVDCGFTNGARFVLVKRTDSIGNWYVFDTARGIVANNDPYILLNTSDAEVTSRDLIDPSNGGFIVNQEANTNLCVNGGTYIYLAIA